MPEFSDYQLIAFTNALQGTLETTTPGNGILASAAQAIGGSNATALMTPFTTQQAIAQVVFNFAPADQAVPLSNLGVGYVLGKTGTGDYDFDWVAAGTGTVQGVSVATANGFAGVSDGDPITPQLTISTTLGAGEVPVGNGTGGFQSAPVTGTGNIVLANSPTLVSPSLGTPTSITLTNGTGLPVSTGISGLGTGIATFLATPSSANLATAVTDETGSGALVFANSPTLVTPNLGTPSAINLTNATNVPPSTPRVTATASTATLTPNANTTDVAAVTAQAAGLTVAAPTGTPVDGQQLTIRIRDNGTTRTITWNAAYVEFATGQLPTDTVVGKTIYAIFWYNAAATAWELVGGNPVAGVWGE
jgi:hypothetical protein